MRTMFCLKKTDIHLAFARGGTANPVTTSNDSANSARTAPSNTFILRPAVDLALASALEPVFVCVD